MRIVRSSDYQNRPFALRVFNAAWRGTYSLGTELKLTKDKLIQAARKQTGLKDFGSEEDWEEPLEVLLRSINEEARLHPFGRMITKIRLSGLLANRLRAQYWFDKHPEILEQEVYPILLIAGLQRTGTTKLQRLLAADPDTRSLCSWEALNPAPWPKVKEGMEDPRIKEARKSEKGLKFISPDFFAIHPVEYDSPEEDILLLDMSFRSTVAEATMHVPAYADWIEKQDQRPAYEYMKKILKLLQWQRPAKRWVLKSPHHLEFLATCREVFPDTKIIWPHRDPLKTMPSFFSMVAHSRYIFSDIVMADEVAEHWGRKIAYMLERAMAYREQVDSNDFLDLKYQGIVDDGPGTVKAVYEKTGLKWTETVLREIKNQEAGHGQHRYGKHVYDITDFGMSETRLSMLVDAYRKAYGFKV